MRKYSSIALAIWASLWMVFGAPGVGTAESDLSPEKLRDAFQQSLKTSAFRPKFDFQAFDFLEELVELRQNEKWLNMFRLLDEQLDDVRNQMIPVDEGMWMTVGQWCDQLLRELPPEGLDKVRLYVDSRAKQSLEDIESVTDIDELYRRYDRFSVSSYGHQFADQLGDALFENGNFHDAVIIWSRALLHDSTDVSEARVMTKRAIALCYMNAPARLAQVCEQLVDRFGAQMIEIGGRERRVDELALELTNRVGRAGLVEKDQKVFRPDDPETWEWSVYWPELEEAAKRSLPIAYAANDNFAIVHLGYAAAGFDRRTAKLTWIHEHGDPHEPPSSRQSQRLMPRQLVLLRGGMRAGFYSNPIPASTRTVPAVSMERFIMRMNRTEPSPDGTTHVAWTIHAVEARTGKLQWTTDETLEGLQIMADPIVVNGSAFVVCRPTNSNQLSLNALDEATGKLKWQMPLGSVDILSTGQPDREVRLSNSGDRLYVFAGGEVIISVNTRQQTVNWLYQVKRKQPQNLDARRRIILRGRGSAIYAATTKPLSAMVDNLQVFLLDPELKELTCIDEDTQEARWKQEAMTGRIVGTDSINVYVCDEEQRLLAISRETGKLIWENQLPMAIEAVYSIGANVYIPYGPSLYVLNQSDGAKSTVKAISEAGEIQRLVRDGNQAIAIARDYVTVFSLLGQSP